ncbi:MAG: sigma factor [Gallionellaceae bacterium]
MGYAYFGETDMSSGRRHNTVQTWADVSSWLNRSGSLSLLDEELISNTLSVDLVTKIATPYVNRGVSFFDLFQAGSFGFTYALENFEVEGGSSFSIYAARCIRKNIKLAIIKRLGLTRSLAAPKIKPQPVIKGRQLIKVALQRSDSQNIVVR